jgi:hypothetical protein
VKNKQLAAHNGLLALDVDLYILVNLLVRYSRVISVLFATASWCKEGDIGPHILNSALAGGELSTLDHHHLMLRRKHRSVYETVRRVGTCLDAARKKQIRISARN